jgi:hypothetical protein
MKAATHWAYSPDALPIPALTQQIEDFSRNHFIWTSLATQEPANPVIPLELSPRYPPGGRGGTP